MAGGPGFEPGLTESESAILPLNYPPSISRKCFARRSVCSCEDKDCQPHNGPAGGQVTQSDVQRNPRGTTKIASRRASGISKPIINTPVPGDCMSAWVLSSSTIPATTVREAQVQLLRRACMPDFNSGEPMSGTNGIRLASCSHESIT
jgi:hypothetical protein